MPYSDYPHGSIAARGEEIYYHQLRKKVESKHKGKFLTIDIETGAYEIDAEAAFTLDKLTVYATNGPWHGS
jgi:hypothetical protein